MEKFTGALVRIKEWIFEADWPTRLGVLAVAISIVSCVAGLWASMAAEADYVRERSSNEAAITRLEAELAEAQGVEVESQEEISDIIARADEVTEAVAKVQTRLVTDSEMDSLSAMSEFVAQDDNKWLGSWILGLDTEYSWHASKSYEMDGTNVPVLWQAISSDGEILAYATADFSADDMKLHDIVLNLTSAGRSKVGATTTPAGDVPVTTDAN